jgi:hypothetical protein
MENLTSTCGERQARSSPFPRFFAKTGFGPSAARPHLLGFDPDAIVHGILQPLATSQVVLCRLNAHMTEQELDLFQLSACYVAEPRARAPQVVRSQLGKSCLGCTFLHHSPDDFFSDSFPQTDPLLFTHRKIRPLETRAATVQSSTAALTQSGTGTVRICPAFPTRSIMAQWPSLCCRCSIVRWANLDRRSPQVKQSARMARLRLPRMVPTSGASSKALASSAVNQFPRRTPSRLAPFTRRIPAADSGLIRPVSAAS